MYNYSWALNLATVIASETNETIDHILWNMPLTMTFKMISIVYSMKTGKNVPDHVDRRVIRAQQKAFAEYGQE